MNDNLTPVTVTADDIKKFAPYAKREYITAILANLSHLRSSGVLENEMRWCHFIGQCAHETDGFTILRESLNYKSVKRIRAVWPARFKSWSDDQLKPLVNNPQSLGDAVYGGRMGNRAKGDGYAYRGGGVLQTTGSAAVAEYAGSLGLDPIPALLDDVNITLQFACLEWSQAGCSSHADENDIVKVSKAINTGSATGGVAPVGLDGRKEWFAKAWAIWGDKGKADKPVPKPTTADKVKGGIWFQIKAAFGAIGSLGILGASGFDGPLIPAAPAGIKQSFVNLGTWTDAVPLHDWKQLAVGAGAAAAVAAAPWVKSKVMP